MCTRVHNTLGLIELVNNEVFDVRSVLLSAWKALGIRVEFLFFA